MGLQKGLYEIYTDCFLNIDDSIQLEIFFFLKLLKKPLKDRLMSDRVNLVVPASPIKCLFYLPNVRAIQYKLGQERLTRLGNSNVLRLPVLENGIIYEFQVSFFVGNPVSVISFTCADTTND